MSTAILKREPLAVEETHEEIDLMLGNLGREAEAKLEYRALRQEAGKLKTALSLKQTLLELGIHPFTEASVTAYKEKCERRAEPLLARHLAESAGLVFLLSLVSLPVLVIGALAGAATVSFYAANTFAASLTLAIAGGLMATRQGIERKWKMHRISKYTGEIPSFALQTAIDVTDACPEAKFYVCSLEEKQTVVDPFLVLRIGEKDYYLEVWNEPDFNGEREV